MNASTKKSAVVAAGMAVCLASTWESPSRRRRRRTWRSPRPHRKRRRLWQRPHPARKQVEGTFAFDQTTITLNEHIAKFFRVPSDVVCREGVPYEGLGADFRIAVGGDVAQPFAASLEVMSREWARIGRPWAAPARATCPTGRFRQCVGHRRARGRSLGAVRARSGHQHRDVHLRRRHAGSAAPDLPGPAQRRDRLPDQRGGPFRIGGGTNDSGSPRRPRATTIATSSPSTSPGRRKRRVADLRADAQRVREPAQHCPALSLGKEA